jgi:hypothetical protein
MADSNASQLQALLVAQYVAQESRADQLTVTAIGIFPSENVETSNLQTLIPLATSMDAEVSQNQVMVVGQGRITDRTVRVWSFSLDGHDFYCITLGGASTLVYDLTTGAWSEWSSPGLAVWRAHKGQNWVTMDYTTYATGVTSNVVAGDDNRGLLWTLDPTQGYDETATDGEPVAFYREVTGGIPGSMRETTKVGAVYLTGSMAKPQLTGAGITLSTSDDNGLSWTDHGTVVIEQGNYDQEWSWRSLGLVKSPGKLFRLTDSGGSVRFDRLEMR